MLKRTKSEWQVLRREYLEGLRTARGVSLRHQKGAWCVTADHRWVAIPGVTATVKPDTWWLGIMRDEFMERRAAGAILLCASADEPLRDFGLPAELIIQIEPYLSHGSEPIQLHFTVVRQRERFHLQLKGGRTVDITERLGDVSWLDTPLSAHPSPIPAASSLAGHSIAAEAAAPRSLGSDAMPGGEELRFFARAVESRLEPIDPIDLAAGTTYLVRIVPAPGVPRSAALRRMLARGGPADLPRDLAEQHDHYAHGAPRR
jgi:hypothetical protein